MLAAFGSLNWTSPPEAARELQPNVLRRMKPSRAADGDVSIRDVTDPSYALSARLSRYAGAGFLAPGDPNVSPPDEALAVGPSHMKGRL